MTELAPTSFDLVIFDCDGVLVDSERLVNQLGREVLAELGLELSMEQMVEHFIGHSMATVRRKIQSMLGTADGLDEFTAEWRKRSRAELTNKLTTINGIDELLEQLTIPHCVASNSQLAMMHTKLAATGLLARFEGRMFSAVDLARPKPSPDVYLHAAEQMGTEPDRCLVIEDSPVGVAAGVAAGMTVFGYSDLIPSHRLIDAGATLVFDQMTTLHERIYINT